MLGLLTTVQSTPLGVSDTWHCVGVAHTMGVPLQTPPELQRSFEVEADPSSHPVFGALFVNVQVVPL